MNGDSLISRRKFIRRSGLLASGGVVGAMGFSYFWEPFRLEIKKHSVKWENLPPELRGLRIVQLSDIHHGPWMPMDFVQKVIKETDALKPDLVFLTGDYVHHSKRYVRPVVEALRGLKPSIGMVGVLGNHDWWHDGEYAREEFRKVGIPLMDNRRTFLDRDRKLVPDAKEGLCIAGVGDLWEDSVRFDLALGGVPENMTKVLLCHNPDAAEKEELREGGWKVDLIFSGHTHAGQVRLPFLGSPVVPSRFGQKYACGFCAGPACKVYVSSGIGMSGMPIRFGTRPEIGVFEVG